MNHPRQADTVMAEKNEKIIILKIRNLINKFGKQVVHDQLNLDVYRGEILGVVGGSGSGKTVLLNSILGLRKPQGGTIHLYDYDCCDRDAIDSIRSKWGVLFQSGALFSSMTVADNIKVPMREIAKIPEHLMDEIVRLKLSMVGLEPDTTAAKIPSELSGGMIKRVALARALALDPEILFLDEPTSGLDPISAEGFDRLIKTLQKALGLTVFMVTHDLDSLLTICDRVAVLVDKKIKTGTIEEMRHEEHPWIKSYFRGVRGRAAGANLSLHNVNENNNNEGET
jgi:phospholipid/cholesterol/gamma-HCH transport system ATP-binding protein